MRRRGRGRVDETYHVMACSQLEGREQGGAAISSAVVEENDRESRHVSWRHLAWLIHSLVEHRRTRVCRLLLLQLLVLFHCHGGRW